MTLLDRTKNGFLNKNTVILSGGCGCKNVHNLQSGGCGCKLRQLRPEFSGGIYDQPENYSITFDKLGTRDHVFRDINFLQSESQKVCDTIHNILPLLEQPDKFVSKYPDNIQNQIIGLNNQLNNMFSYLQSLPTMLYNYGLHQCGQNHIDVNKTVTETTTTTHHLLQLPVIKPLNGGKYENPANYSLLKETLTNLSKTAPELCSCINDMQPALTNIINSDSIQSPDIVNALSTINTVANKTEELQKVIEPLVMVTNVEYKFNPQIITETEELVSCKETLETIVNEYAKLKLKLKLDSTSNIIFDYMDKVIPIKYTHTQTSNLN